MSLQGKIYLVLGVANKNSIAWAVTEALLREGAQVILTYQSERIKDRVTELATTINPPLPMFEMDATDTEAVERVFAEIGRKYSHLDGVVHSIAYAPKEDLQPGITRTPSKNFSLAMHVSAYSLVEITRAAMPMFEKAGGGSVITMTYDTSKVIPNYNLMGIAKATLEQIMRYLAWEGGPKNVRVNAVSAGPIKTLASRGISNFSGMFDHAAKKAPMGRNVTVEEVANLSVFLLSPLSSGVTGQVIYVDAGLSIVGDDGTSTA